jgi:hypothetical protein
MNSLGVTGEFALIDWIRRREPERPIDSWTRVGIGDDCAILGVGEGTGAGLTGPRDAPAGTGDFRMPRLTGRRVAT